MTLKVFTIICRALRRRVVVALDDRASHWSAFKFSRHWARRRVVEEEEEEEEQEEANIDRKYLYVRRSRFDGPLLSPLSSFLLRLFLFPRLKRPLSVVYFPLN